MTESKLLTANHHPPRLRAGRPPLVFDLRDLYLLASLAPNRDLKWQGYHSNGQW